MQLERNEFMKTYDELSRSIKRQERYLEKYGHLLPLDERDAAEEILDRLQKAMDVVPAPYRLTKWEYDKTKGKV